MQSAPPEDPSNATSGNTTQDTSSSFHDGLPTFSDETCSGQPPSGPVVAESPSSIDAPDDASVASSSTSRGRAIGLGRMSTGHDSQESSPGSRVDAYERANAIRRRPSDSMIFQVIPSSGQSASNSNMLDMPNGQSQPEFCLDTTYRI